MRIKLTNTTSGSELTYSRVKKVRENENKIELVFSSNNMTTTYNEENWIYEIIAEVVVRDCEAGNIIDSFETIEEAEKAIKKYEEEDEKEGTYKPNFYEIAVWNELDECYLTFSIKPIKRERLKKGLTQAQLAEAAGSSIRTIQDWESGRRIPRDVYVLRDVARALGCRIEDLIE